MSSIKMTQNVGLLVVQALDAAASLRSFTKHKYENLKVPCFSITDLKISKLSHMNMHIYNYSHSYVLKLSTRLLLCIHKMAMAHC